MQFFQLLPALLLVAGPAHSLHLPEDTPAGCSMFTVGNCDANKDELIETYPIPDSPTALSLCQEVCQIQEGCNFFEYDKNATSCYLFRYRYLESCQLIGGPADPLINECVQNVQENNCQSFIKENCVYQGTPVFDKYSVTDRVACQNFLIALGAIYNANYFVYNSDEHECIFYDSTDMDCGVVSGPVSPDLDGCAATTASGSTATTQFTTSSTTTTTTTTTTATGSTASPATTATPTPTPTSAP